MAIELQNVSKSFGEKQVLQNFSHVFPEGELTCVMGPSGCGKTTLLSRLLGLEQPDSGRVLGMEGRRKSAVFQEDRLCENAGAVSNLRLVNPTLTREEAEAMLRDLGLEHVSLAELSRHCPPQDRERTAALSQQVLRSYQVLSSAQQTARTLMESRLHRIEQELEQWEAGHPSAPRTAAADFRA